MLLICFGRGDFGEGGEGWLLTVWRRFDCVHLDRYVPCFWVGACLLGFSLGGFDGVGVLALVAKEVKGVGSLRVYR